MTQTAQTAFDSIKVGDDYLRKKTGDIYTVVGKYVGFSGLSRVHKIKVSLKNRVYPIRAVSITAFMSGYFQVPK